MISKNGVLTIRDKVCEKKKPRRIHENTGWRNEKIQGAIRQKIVACEDVRQSIEENYVSK